MEPALPVILIVIANLVMYWVFWGKKKFDQKLNHNQNLTAKINTADHKDI